MEELGIRVEYGRWRIEDGAQAGDLPAILHLRSSILDLLFSVLVQLSSSPTTFAGFLVQTVQSSSWFKPNASI